MPQLYPLRFQPVLKQYVWGGRRLQTLLGKPIPAGETCAESWEAVDHQQDQSVVAAGPLAGETLHSVLERYGPDLLGRHDPQPRFPLLFKYLDAAQTLSVQVHPNDQQAAQLDPPDLGKTEAWVVLAAEPGSKIYAGLQGRGVAYNIFLDGNLYRDSLSVDRKPLVYDAELGMTLGIGRFPNPVFFAFGLIWRGKEFDGQQSSDNFASATLGMHF